jgi:hypothetical protein
MGNSCSHTNTSYQGWYPSYDHDREQNIIVYVYRCNDCGETIYLVADVDD